MSTFAFGLKAAGNVGGNEHQPSCYDQWSFGVDVCATVCGKARQTSNAPRRRPSSGQPKCRAWRDVGLVRSANG